MGLYVSLACHCSYLYWCPKNPVWRLHPFFKDQVTPASSKETVQLYFKPTSKESSLTRWVRIEGKGKTVFLPLSVAFMWWIVDSEALLCAMLQNHADKEP